MRWHAAGSLVIVAACAARAPAPAPAAAAPPSAPPADGRAERAVAEPFHPPPVAATTREREGLVLDYEERMVQRRLLAEREELVRSDFWDPCVRDVLGS